VFRRLGRSVIESKALDLREVNSWANDLLGTDRRQLLTPGPDNYFCRCGEFPLLLG